jgi:hypothetical protein
MPKNKKKVKQPERQPSGSQALPARCDAATAVAPPSSSRRPASVALTFEYHDCFLGRVWRVAVVQGLWLQIHAPLQFIQRAWWFHVQKTPLSLRTALHQRPPPVVDMAALWPAQRARVMFSLTAMTCQRMSTAPDVPFRTACQWLWKTRVFSRVLARYVSKIQVRLAAAVQQLVLLILLTALQQTRAEYRVRYGFVLELQTQLLLHDVRLTRPRPFAGCCCCPNKRKAQYS